MVTGRAGDRDKIISKLSIQNQRDDRDETNNDKPTISEPKTTASNFRTDDGSDREQGYGIQLRRERMGSRYFAFCFFFCIYIFYLKNGILGILKYYWEQNWKSREYSLFPNSGAPLFQFWFLTHFFGRNRVNNSDSKFRFLNPRNNHSISVLNFSYKILSGLSIADALVSEIDFHC